MNYNSHICYNIIVSYFKWRHITNYGKFPFTHMKGIHVHNGENMCAIYVIWNTSTLEIYWNRWSFCQSASQLPQAWKISIISRNFNFTPDVSIHAIVTCQGIFVPVPAFADYFSSLVQDVVRSVNGDLQLFI